MCRKPTPASKLVRCGRCNKVANPTDGWEHGWPLYGHLEVGFPAQAFGALCGMGHVAAPEHFQWWAEGHPALIENGAQEIIFEWGTGYHFDSKGRFRLCYICQKELLKMLGQFFGIPKRAAELKQISQGTQRGEKKEVAR